MAKKKYAQYAPLRFIEKQKDMIGTNAADFLNLILKRERLTKSNYTEDDYVRFWHDIHSLSEPYQGKYPELEKAFTGMSILNIMEYIGYNIRDFETNKLSLKTELTDNLYFPILIERWERNKQVFKIDEEFAEALYSTDKLKSYLSCLQRLPVNNFYVDLSDIKAFKPFDGVFVEVQTYKTIYSNRQDDNEVCDVVSIMMYMLTDNDIFYSYACHKVFSNSGDGCLEINFKDFPEPPKDFTPSTFGIDASEQHDTQITRQKIAVTCLQLLNYLGSSEPDINENPETKRTYKKPAANSVPSNRFNEIQQWDVGVRFGNSIRLKVKEYQSASCSITHTGSHAPKRPHFRSGHWHHFWTGKKDGSEKRELIVKWLEPTFVGDGEVITTIHKII